MAVKEVNSITETLEKLFSEKYDVDFYQREYVWQTKQVEDLINDLSNEFLRHWDNSHTLDNVKNYDPYFMGEIVISVKPEGRNAIIDGQQRITTFTLLLMYIKNTYGTLSGFPSKVDDLIYSDDYGEKRFNLEISERKDCMLSLYDNGIYTVKDDDSSSVENLVARYEDFEHIWNEKIENNNVVAFTYWIINKIMFSKVWTNSDDFAYVIFETMNDRGLSLTQVEMVRSYLLANINEDERDLYKDKFDGAISLLLNVKLSSKSKAEFEFFKVYLRGHFAEDFSQKRSSDFSRIGNEFHRWVRDNNLVLGLKQSSDYCKFIDRIVYFTKRYKKINDLILQREASKYLYVIVNADYGFTMQMAALLSAIEYEDSDEVVEAKIKIVSKYITKVLTWRVWNQKRISQSSLEDEIYGLCYKLRDKSIEDIQKLLGSEPIELPELEYSPTLNQQNRNKLKVLLALVTEIVAQNSNESSYILNTKAPIEVEHIWSDHFEQHTNEFEDESSFNNTRNNIGDLLLLPKSFNASYNDSTYDVKVQQYFSQNILAQSLNGKKYENSPGFVRFIATFKEKTGVEFKSYSEFKRANVVERANLYKEILKWNWL